MYKEYQRKKTNTYNYHSSKPCPGKSYESMICPDLKGEKIKLYGGDELYINDLNQDSFKVK